MMKKLFCLLLTALLTAGSVRAEGWLNDANAPDSVENVTDSTVYDAADAAGTVVNADEPENPSDQEMIVYSFTPLDVVLIVDVSGSMGRTDDNSSQTLLGYARDAADTFARTLFEINPASRVALVYFCDDATVGCELTGFANQEQLLQAVSTLYEQGSSTNTGSGFFAAADLLDATAMAGRRRAVLMITDGQANSGSSRPISYAVSGGEKCAETALVYTIGLIGGLEDYAASATRQALDAGYATRYFEVDFDQIADGGAVMYQTIMATALSMSAAETIAEDGSIVAMDTYLLSAGEGFDLRVTHESGAYLSSYADDQSTSAPFGTLTIVDGKKQAVMMDDDYTVTIEGVSTAKGGYSLSALRNAGMDEETLVASSGWSHPSMAAQIDIQGGEAAFTDLGYSCLDVTATDWNGQPTQGIESGVDAITKGNVSPLAAPAQYAAKADQLDKGDHVKVLAIDSKAGYYFISFTSKDGKLSRGWAPLNTLTEPQGFVPEMSWLDGKYTLSAKTQSYRAPDEAAATAYEIPAGTVVTLRHAERAADGSEWAYVSIPHSQNPRNAYVPVSCLEGWTTMAPEGFRVGDAPFADTLSFPKLPIAAGQQLQIYSGPDTSYWRGANGKAMVSTNGGLYAEGWVENGWLLVQYGTTIGNRRVGYIRATDFKVEVPVVPQIIFQPKAAVITAQCILTDDPENFSEEIRTLEPGFTVTWLADYTRNEGHPLCYIETKVNGKKVRAFVPAECIEIQE